MKKMLVPSIRATGSTGKVNSAFSARAGGARRGVERRPAPAGAAGRLRAGWNPDVVRLHGVKPCPVPRSQCVPHAVPWPPMLDLLEGPCSRSTGSSAATRSGCRTTPVGRMPVLTAGDVSTVCKNLVPLDPVEKLLF